MARNRFEDSNMDVRLSDQDFEMTSGIEAQLGPALQRIFHMARKWRYLQREIRLGAAVVLVKDGGCECNEIFWGERAVEDANRVLDEHAQRRLEEAGI